MAVMQSMGTITYTTIFSKAHGCTMTDSQKWLILVFLLVMAGLIYLLAPIITPFAIAIMLAYLGDPLADRLEVLKFKNYQLGRTGAVIVVFTAMLLIIVMAMIILVPLIESQISYFIKHFPAYTKWINATVIPWVGETLGFEINRIETDKLVSVIRKHWQQAGKGALTLMGTLSYSGAVIAKWLMNLVLIPVITFYLLRDWDILVEKIHNLIPRSSASTAKNLAIETNTVLAAFMHGQFYVMLALGIIYSAGLSIVGLNLAILIGVMAGLISFVPYLGASVGIVVACIAAFLQFQDVMILIPVAIVFMVGQMIESMLLTPWLVGDKVGLHPVAVMFSILAGGQLFGFFGVLLALPVASVIMVGLRHVHEIYRDSSFYMTEKDPAEKNDSM